MVATSNRLLPDDLAGHSDARTKESTYELEETPHGFRLLTDVDVENLPPLEWIHQRADSRSRSGCALRCALAGEDLPHAGVGLLCGAWPRLGRTFGQEGPRRLHRGRGGVWALGSGFQHGRGGTHSRSRRT